MSRSRGIIVFIAVLMLASSIPILSGQGDEGVATRAEALTGHISADVNWNSDVVVEDIIIDQGVTVTVGPGVHVRMTTGAYFYVEGTLLLQGTYDDPCFIECSTPGNTWGFLQVNASGSFHFENFTLKDQDTSHVAFYHIGQPSVLRNGNIDGGHYGLYIWNDGGDVIENVTIHDLTYHGLYIRGNTKRTYIRDITFYNITRTALFFEDSKACTVDGMTASYDFWGVYTFDSSGLYFNDLDLTGDQTTSGMLFVNGLEDIHGSNIVVRMGNYGMFFNTPEGSTANFTNFRTTSSVLTPVYAFPGAHIDLLFKNSDLKAGGSTSMALPSTDSYKNITLINTTWSFLKPFTLTGNSTVDIFWYLDGTFVNENGKYINGTVIVNHDQCYCHDTYDILNGRFGDILVRDRLMYDPALRSPTIYTHTLIFKYDGNPDDMVIYPNLRFDNWTFMRVNMNLRPTNSMPSEIVVDEDVGTLFPLDDNFFEPESTTLVYTIDSGEHIDAYIANGMNEMKVINAEENWYGESWVNVSATDGFNSTYANVTVIVEPVNDLPHLTDDLPVLVIEEDSIGYFNFTGWFEDVEEDTLEISFAQGENYTVSYNVSTMNLTVNPDENLNGMLKINFTISDGIGQKNMVLIVRVKPVNDAPEAEVMIGNISAGMKEHEQNETTSIMVYDLMLEEDSMIEFWIHATDVDSENLTYSFMKDDLMHGSIEVEVNQIEVIINETSNETEMQNITVPMNFTYTPDANDDAGDLVKFIISDGEADVEFWVWFNVSSVNDPLEFKAPDDWNITVDQDIMSKIDMEDWISDIDGDDIAISTSSDFITVNGTVLELIYNKTMESTSETVTVTVTDGMTQKTAQLLVNINLPGDDDDDDDIEPSLGTPKVTGEEDKWVFEIDGTSGQDLWVVVEDDEGNEVSYKMTFADGKYSVDIPKDDAEEGLSYHISDTEDGDPIDNNYKGTLPELKDEEDDDFSIWIIVLVIIIVLLIVVILAMLITGGKKEKDYDEE